jgi:hypothetical protein
MSSRNRSNETHLTETILTIHNEVQSALDYISSVAVREATELGKSSAVANIERLRIRVPLRLNLEIEQKKLPVPSEITPSTEEIRKILPKRVGLVIERNDPTKQSLVSKVRVSFISGETAPSKTAEPENIEVKETDEKYVWGEVEITFVPLKRE